MDVISHRSSLNPNAPLFVPLAYRAVEDFSDQWWSLVHSSPWFRDYWLQECFHDPQFDPVINDICDLDSLFFDAGDDTCTHKRIWYHLGDEMASGSSSACSGTEACGEGTQDCDCENESTVDSATEVDYVIQRV
ncbi:hypothetical protein GH714_037450 [Hevea brasiliensis]|uniref:Uncharacterized protein n=1 Tax=Hevea brasiliensis TaxID=3981 RepID=A0A6A6L4M9_HEVBR|nr:hypothetical protein GH714_037450 [Hevea brasiliensis]